MGHILVDLDGTLASYNGSTEVIGDPIPKMLARVKDWLASGETVKIFTARASIPEYIPAVEEWCLKHIGEKLEVTNQKDFATMEIWDDRAVRVVFNTGRTCCQGPGSSHTVKDRRRIIYDPDTI